MKVDNYYQELSTFMLLVATLKSGYKKEILNNLNCYTETEFDNIIDEYINNNKTNKYLRCEDTYELTSIILKADYNKFKLENNDNNSDDNTDNNSDDNPYTSYDFEEVQKYINVSEPVIFNKKIFNEQYDKLIDLYSKNNIIDFSSESRKELFKYLESMYQQHYDVMKTFINFK